MGLSLIVLLVALACAAWTDVRRHKIYNWTTYPAIVFCTAARAWDEGLEGLVEAAIGFFACGGLMLICYAGLDVGGGDVKLAALIGTALGWINGLYALLWMFMLAGTLAASLIIWHVGAWNLLKLAFRREDNNGRLREQLRHPLFLAPAALAAVLIVTAPWVSGPATGIACYPESISLLSPFRQLM